MAQLAELFRERREKLGMTRQQVIEKTPYQNISKGMLRLYMLEDGGWVPDDKVLAWLSEALDIAMDDVHQALDADGETIENQITRRLPADGCAVCGQSLDDVGGRRLLTTISRALLIKGLPAGWNGRWRELRAVRLDDPYSQLFVILAGFKATDEVMDRIRVQAQSGQTPWFCQRCAGQVCERCGSLEKEHPGSLFVADDGKTTYYGLLPIGYPGCSVPGCGGHR